MKQLLLLAALIFSLHVKAQNKYCYDTSILLSTNILVEEITSDTIQVITKEFLPVSENCIRKSFWRPRKKCWTMVTHDSIIYSTVNKEETIQIDSPFTVCNLIPATHGAMIFGLPDALIEKAAVLNSLGLHTVRESILVTGWPNNQARCAFWQNNAFENVININYLPQQTETSTFCPPDSLQSYEKKVGEILDKYSNIQIAVCENEEANRTYRNLKLTSIHNYLKQIQAFKRAANARNILVTNGGFTTDMLKALTYRWLLTLSPDVIEAKGLLSGKEFLDSCFLGIQKKQVVNKNNGYYEERIAEASWLIDEYNRIAIDRINIHLYFPLAYRGSGISAEGITTAVGLKEIIAFMRSRTSIPIISNEVGSVNTNPETITNMLHAFNQEGLDYVIYWSGNDDNPFGAKSIHNSDGTLNNAGIAFKNFISQLK